MLYCLYFFAFFFHRRKALSNGHYVKNQIFLENDEENDINFMKNVIIKLNFSFYTKIKQN